MSRLGVYAAVSTALAAGVVVSAFHQRPNFYSACVYLSQSNLCLMIIINLILLIYSSFMYGLQRLCYGPLRPIEIEQLYEKGWFAVTETCLAMTIFREEVGAWFLVMFVALLTGKVWGWIGDGRVEILEQQPPANPRLFHIRLSISLAMSSLYDIWLMSYTIKTVIQQARPNMMVMFLFEFAILTTCSFATASRYAISLIETRVIQQQTVERLAERRREVREERAEMIRQREEAASATAGEGQNSEVDTAPLPSEDDVDEMDIEVPGWEAKGQWVLTLDLVADFLKLMIYVAFFVILLIFYGLPIYIMRELFMTGRSFTKRLAAFLRYRRATQDMNSKYEDATVEDIQREDTCIICREEMRPWSVTNPPAAQTPQGQRPAPRPTSTVNERSRPKKLPCGHILHLGCLKSWLERQQACPTCRRPVVETTQPPGAGDANNRNAAGQGAAAVPIQNGQNAPPGAPRPPNMRMLNLGPLRLGFGQGNLRDIAGAVGADPQPGQAHQGPAGPRVYGLELGFPRRQPAPAQVPTGAARTVDGLQEQILQIQQTILEEIQNLQASQQQLQLVQLLQTELARLQVLQSGGPDPLAPPNFQNFQMPHLPNFPQRPVANSSFPTPVQYMERHTVRPSTVAIPSGSLDLPPGVSIPEGWTLLPMHRMDGPPAGVHSATEIASPAGPASSVALANSTATRQPTFSPTNGPTNGPSNNNLSPTPTRHPSETTHQSQASSVDSSDINALHTPSSPSASTILNAPIQSDFIHVPGSSTLPSPLPDYLADLPPIIDRPNTPGGAPALGPNGHPPEDDARLTSTVRRGLDAQTAEKEEAEKKNRAEESEEDEEDEDDEEEEEEDEEEEDEEEEEEEENHRAQDTRGSSSGKGKGIAVSIEDADDEDA